MPEETTGADKIIQLAERLAFLADAAGVPRPDLTALHGPQVDVRQPIRTIVLEIADHLRGRNLLFVRAGVPGTIEPDGQWKTMTADRLTSWLGRIGITTVKGRRDPVPEDLSLATARQVLAADDLLMDLPRINGVHLVRQPVLRRRLDERGLRALELLPIGYDEESGIYTVAGGAITEDLYPEDGEAFLRRLLRYFPWSDEARMSAQLAYMLTCFAGRCFRAGRRCLFSIRISRSPGSPIWRCWGFGRCLVWWAGRR